jgi:hypothetical protein
MPYTPELWKIELLLNALKEATLILNQVRTAIRRNDEVALIKAEEEFSAFLLRIDADPAEINRSESILQELCECDFFKDKVKPE